MPNRRFSSLLALLVLLSAGQALGQGRCGFLSDDPPPPWFSADFGMGMAATIPVSADNKVKMPALGLGGRLVLNLPPRYHVAARIMTKRFAEDPENSTYEWGRHLDLLLEGGLSAVATRHFQWDLHLVAGTTMATIRHDEPALDEQGDWVYFEGKRQLVGKRSTIWTFVTGGLGTRITLFPIDAVGIFLDATATFAYHSALKMEWGPLTVNALLGAEAHF